VFENAGTMNWKFILISNCVWECRYNELEVHINLELKVPHMPIWKPEFS